MKCVCEFRRPVFIHDNSVATHVYRIAEEAVSNALTHGKATEITIGLSETRDGAVLTVRDNGSGLPKHFDDGGLELHMMRYRARMIRGSIELRRNTPHGMMIVCCFQKHTALSAH